MFKATIFAWLNVKAWNDKGSTFGASFCWFLSSVRGILRSCLSARRSRLLVSPFVDAAAHGINRSTGGHGYWRASGEILRPLQERHQRKHLAIVLSLIKDERSGIEED